MGLFPNHPQLYKRYALGKMSEVGRNLISLRHPYDIYPKNSQKKVKVKGALKNKVTTYKKGGFGRGILKIIITHATLDIHGLRLL